mmetsp:Transcript_70188/g.62973  ORF Transcript_70188/g.62973 Transcript_70188/m.62973 type:complete len:461 (-) Transcript_70188:85-1467(-)
MGNIFPPIPPITLPPFPIFTLPPIPSFTPAPTVPGAPPVPNVDYIYVDEPRLGFGEAQAYCLATYGSNLATIYNDDLIDAERVIDFAGEATWIGLYDRSSTESGLWQWRNGDQCEYPSPGTCVNYWGFPLNENGISEPLCIKGDEGGFPCGYIKEGKAYNNLDCTERRPFICHLASTSQTLGSCPCDYEITEYSCDEDNGDYSVSFRCINDPSVEFNDDTEAIQSCIYIENDIIPDGITVEDVIVTTKFSHTFVGDLFGWLRKGAQYILLFDGKGSANDVDASFSDAGTLSHCANTNCNYGGYGIGGDRCPVNPLSNFDGDAANGIWGLSILDTLNGDSGEFGRWELKLKLSQCPNIPEIYLSSAKSINLNNDYRSNPMRKYLFDGKDTKHTFVEIIGLNIIISAIISILLTSMVYCICCRKKIVNQSTKSYDKVGGVEDVDIITDDEQHDDEIPMKDNL